MKDIVEPQLDILLVDDDAADAALFGLAVAKTGLKICLRTLSGGRQAIDYLEAKGQYQDRLLNPVPDVIVLDLRMPGLNGFDFLAWRMPSTFYSAIPVVIFTGSNDPAEVKRVFQLGAGKHIVKPVNLEDWAKVVQQIWDFATEGTAFFQNKGREGAAAT